MDSEKWKKRNTKMKTKREKAALKYKTFIGNKQEGQGFADKRKKKITHDYHKSLQKEKQKMQEWSEKTRKIYEEAEREQKPDTVHSKKKPRATDTSSTKRPSNPQKVSRYHKAETTWQKAEEEKKKRIEEYQRKQEEKEAALKRYKNKKKDVHKKLAVKNYKGQPNMSAQMDLLLEKIQRGAEDS